MYLNYVEQNCCCCCLFACITGTVIYNEQLKHNGLWSLRKPATQLQSNTVSRATLKGKIQRTHLTHLIIFIVQSYKLSLLRDTEYVPKEKSSVLSLLILAMVDHHPDRVIQGRKKIFEILFPSGKINFSFHLPPLYNIINLI